MQDKKYILWMINFFLLYFALCVFQDNYLAEKELLLNINQVQEYCSIHSLVNNCVSAIDIQSLIDANYTGEIRVNVYSKLYIPVQYLKYLLLAVNFLLFVFIIRRNKTNSDVKIPFGLVLLFSLLASYKFIYLYTNNIVTVPFVCIAAVTILSCLIFVLIFYLMKYLTKDSKMAVLFALYFCFLMYNTNYVNTTSVQIFNIIIVLLLMMNSENIIKSLKIFTVTLFCLCTVNAGYKFVSQYNFDFGNNAEKSKPTALKFTKNPKSNIYIFLFDMYGGSESLKKVFGYDNSAFVQELRKQGFYVNDNINSNYNKTIFSISSCLNFKYVADIEYETPSDAISYAEIFKIAKELSYKIFYFNSYPIGMTVTEDVIDRVYSTENKLYMVSNLFFNNTIFCSYISDLFYQDEVSFVFDTCYKVINSSPKDKKLLFFHFLMPHHPFLYDENGTKIARRDKDFTSEEDMLLLNKTRYLQYLKYTNTKILELIKFVKENDKNDPIIIVFGDHGCRAKVYFRNPEKHIAEMGKYDYLVNFNTILAYYNKNSDYSAYKENDLLNFYIRFSNDVFGTDIKNTEEKHLYFDTQLPILKMNDIEWAEFKY